MNLSEIMKQEAKRRGFTEKEIEEAFVEEVKKTRLVVEFEKKNQTVEKLLRKTEEKQYVVPKKMARLIRVQECGINIDYPIDDRYYYESPDGNGSSNVSDFFGPTFGPQREKPGLFVSGIILVEKETPHD